MIEHGTRNEILEKIRSKKPVFVSMLDFVDSFRVFGSVARNEFTDDSDVDFLLSFNKRPTLLDIGRSEEVLEQVLGLKVDVVPESSLSEEFMHVLDECVTI